MGCSWSTFRIPGLALPREDPTHSGSGGRKSTKQQQPHSLPEGCLGCSSSGGGSLGIRGSPPNTRGRLPRSKDPRSKTLSMDKHRGSGGFKCLLFALLCASCVLLATLFATLGRSWGALGVLLAGSIGCKRKPQRLPQRHDEQKKSICLRFASRRLCLDAACFVRSGSSPHASNLVK